MSEPVWLARARKFLGVHEAAGDKDNPVVVDFYRRAGHPEIRHDATPWCAAFVGAVLRDCGLKSTGGLAAREYEGWGERLDRPLLGCVGVKKRPGGGWVGHVGFVVAANGETVWMLGGNQGDAVSIAGFAREDFTAFRWPKNYARTGLAPLPSVFSRAALDVSQA